MSAWFVEGLATRGKKRTGGVRTPFTWRAPRYSMFGTDVFKPLLRAARMLEDSHHEKPYFLLPDFWPPNVPLEAVTGIRMAPMTGGRFNYYVRAITQNFDKHVTATEVKDITYHRWRHLLPTLADRSMMSATERTTVGLWTGGRDDEGTSTLARRMAMLLLYASERGVSEAVTKTELIRGYRRAVVRHLQMGKKLESQWLLKRYQEQPRILPTLDQLVPVWPARADITEETKHYIHSKLHAGDVTIESQFVEGQCLPFDHPASESEEPSEGVTSQSSDSVADSEGSDVGLVQQDIHFIHGQRLEARLHLRHPGASDQLDPGLTACGRRLVNAIQGVGVEEARAVAREWSPRCFRELTQEVRDRWLCP